MSKKRKILSKLRWFGFGTSGQNQTFGSIQTRSVMLIFISSFKILIIFNSGRIKQTCATLVFKKSCPCSGCDVIIQPLFKNIQKQNILKKDKALIFVVFFISSQYLVWFLHESMTKKTLFRNISNSAKCLIIIQYIPYMVFVIYRAWQSAKTLTEH